jgi:hypothetical protein
MSINNETLSKVALAYLLFLSCIQSIKTTDSQCASWSKKFILNQTERHFFNITSVFISFTHLSELTNLTLCPEINYALTTLKIYSDNEFLLSFNTLDLSLLLSMFTFVEKKRQTLLFQNVKGFNFDKSLANKYVNTELISSFNLNFYNVKFDFYVNETLITENECLLNKRKAFGFTSRDLRSGGFFGSIKSLILSDNVFYNNKICPYAFTRTNLEQVGLLGITDSLIFKNRLKFVSINESGESFDLEARRLVFLKLNVAYTRITLAQVDKFVFKEIQVIYLSGIIDEIQQDLFGYFKVIFYFVIYAFRISHLNGLY